MFDVLIVEDEMAHAELIERAFEARREQFGLQVVSSAAQARQRIDERTPDLLITDLMLPDGRGTELIPDQSAPGFPVVVMTSHGDEKVAVEAIKSGALDYVVKTAETLGSMPHVAERTLREWRQMSELRETQRELRRMSQVFIDASDPIVIADLDGHIVDANPEAVRFYGWPTQKLLGRTMRSLFKPSLRSKAERLLQHSLDGEQVRNVEITQQDCDGQTYTVLLTLSRLNDAEGHPTGVAAIAKDITERKQLEREFRQAQKMEAIGNLSSGIAHDFNNLLMGITGCTDVALSKLEAEHSARSYIAEIKKAALRGSSLTRQLLAFTRKREVEPRVVEFNEVVHEAENLLRPLVSEDIHFTVDVADEPLHVECDPGQIVQVLVNLAINARDAMPEGGRLEVHTQTVDFEAQDARLFGALTSGSYVELTVRDTGTGIDPDVLPHIFEPFFTTKDVGQGTGLGLASIYGIVKQARGEVTVDSTVGEGTTFRVFLPRTFEPSEATQEGEEISLEGHGETVLVVEDDSLVRMTVRGYLERGGYRVLDAEDGAQAITVARQTPHQIDLLVTDMVLPGLKGPEVARRVGANQPNVRVLYMSAHPTDALQASGRLAPDAESLQKPFTEHDLLQEVKLALGERNDDTAHEASDRRPRSAPGDAQQVEHAGRTLLLVEDHELARMTTRELLEDDGYTVLEAATGAQALELAETHSNSLDLIISDLTLPDVDGAQLAQRLRDVCADVNFVFVSGLSADDPEVANLLQTPGTSFVEKPVDFDRLSARIDELLASTSPEPDSAAE